MDILVCYGLGVGTFVIGFLVGVVLLARQYRDRWVAAPLPRAGGEGAFRSAPITPDLRRQRRRYFVLATAIVTVLWATATLFLLVPAGALGSLMGLTPYEPNRWFWLGIGLATLDGIPLSIVLLSASMAILKRTAQTLRLALVGALWSLAHHLVLVGLSLALVALGREEEMAMLTVLTAGAGAVLAACSLVAHHLAREDLPPPALLVDAESA